jgi:dethiobiotin synthetase
MNQSFFITGTDTHVGKTWTTVALMRYLQKQGKSVVGMKPISAGCELINGQWRNDDALLLQQHASIELDYDLINPFAYALPVSPHLACDNNPPDIATIIDRFQQLQTSADIVLVEGAGGWLVPLNKSGDDIQSLAQALHLPVILVVGIKLGCINHARLTYQAIINSGLNCAGWIANCVDKNMLKKDENITTLQQLIPAPLLGELPYLNFPDFDYLAERITLAEPV